MAQTEKSGDGVRAVERALDILLALDSAEQFLSVGELLKRVDLSRPTLYRLLQTLEQKGFVVSNGSPQRFALGPSVGRLANLWTSRSGITPAAQPVMQRLWEATGETVSLLVHQGQQRVCLAEMASLQPLSYRRGHGYSEDVCKGASGRAILAFLDQPQAYLPDTMGSGSRETLLRELSRVRDMGYATSRDELIQGAVAVAAPFFGANGRVLGSLAVFGPSVRLNQERIDAIAAQLVAGASELSRSLGSH